jgi:Tol biopolymer transport system component
MLSYATGIGSADFVGNGTAWAWSPDSTHLAYVYAAKSLGVDSEGDSPLALGIVDAATGKKRLIAPLAAYGPRYNPLDFVDIVAGSDDGFNGLGFVANGVGWTWSPDGKQLANVYPAKSLGVDKDGGSPLATWLVDVATGKRRVLTAGIEPTWSPDGSQVLVRRALTSGGGLWLVPARGGKARPLVPGVRTRLSEKRCFQVLADFDPAWSSDGQWVAFTHLNTRSRAGGDGPCGRQYFTYFVVRADGKGLARALPAPATAVEWPADCSQLFLYRNSRRNGWIVPDAAGTPRFVALVSGQTGDWHC